MLEVAVLENVICFGGRSRALGEMKTEKSLMALVKCKSSPQVVLLILHHSVLALSASCLLLLLWLLLRGSGRKLVIVHMK